MPATFVWHPVNAPKPKPNAATPNHRQARFVFMFAIPLPRDKVALLERLPQKSGFAFLFLIGDRTVGNLLDLTVG
jgi:hypothetical protein